MANEWSTEGIKGPLEVTPEVAKLMQQNIAWQVEIETNPLFEEMHKVFENLKKKQETLSPEFTKILNDNVVDLF